jgi:hypothetical protein
MENLKRAKEIPSFEEIREAMCDFNFGKSWDDFSNDKSIPYVTVLAFIEDCAKKYALLCSGISELNQIKKTKLKVYEILDAKIEVDDFDGDLYYEHNRAEENVFNLECEIGL